MAEMFYFNAPWNPLSADHTGYRLPSRRQRFAGRRKSAVTRMEHLPERACMARCDEPLFCDIAPFPLFGRPGRCASTSLPQGEVSSDDEDDFGGVYLDVPQENQVVEKSGQPPISHKASEGSPQAENISPPVTGTADLAQPLMNFIQSLSPASTALPAHIIQATAPDILGTRSRPEDEDVSLEENGRRPRLALPGEGPDEPLVVHATPNETSSLRGLSQQRSCESLRSVARYGSRPSLFRTNSAGTSAAGITGSSQSMPPVTEGSHEDSPGQETEGFHPLVDPRLRPDPYPAVSTDRVTWDVNDYRHTYDFADFVEEWEFGDHRSRMISDPPFGLREALLSRNAAGAAETLQTCKGGESSQVAGSNKNVTRTDLDSNLYDIQAIPWSDTQTTREVAMQQRAYLHDSIDHREWSTTDSYGVLSNDALEERLFRFHRFNARHRPTFTHYQLRNVVSCQDRDIFYCSGSKIVQAPLVLPNETTVAMDLSTPTVSAEPIKITCIATSPPRTYNDYTTDSVLIAGGFYGEYALRNLHSHDPHTEGYVTYDFNGLVTHIHTFNERRTDALQAAFCSNDSRLRILDIRTLKYTNTFTYEHSLNCAVTSPDGRLRAIVGDSPDALITDAQTGSPLITLKNHTDHIFACAWSPSERHVATAAQDGKTLLWDSRNWSRPLASFASAMTCARSLHFTPDGAALVAAENEDVVRVWDMADAAFERKQDLRFFGTIAGVAVSEEGEELVVANGDRTVGGLLCYRRATGVGVSGSMIPRAGNARERAVRRASRGDVRGRGVMVADLVV